MDKPRLRVLLVEDSLDDAELIVRLINKGGYSVYHERIETAKKMRDALKNREWDIIIADYKMPSFTGIKALDILNEFGIDIPFILVSGTIDEETSLEAMRKGANDYLMKNNFSRLIPVIKRELNQFKIRTNERKFQSQLKESESKFKSIFDNAAVGIVLLSRDFRFIEINDAFAKMLGYEKKKLMGKSILDLTCPEDLEITLEKLNQLAKGKISRYHLEKRYKKKDGGILWAEISVSIINDKDGNFQGISGIIADITKRKKIEAKLNESEHRYRELIEQSPDSIVTFNTGGFVTSCNLAHEKFTGYSKEETIGKHFTKLPFLRLRDIYSYTKIFKELLRNKEPTYYEVPWIKKDGTEHLAEVVIDVIKRDNKIAEFQCIIRDITEKIKAQQQIRESEEKFRSYVENANDIIYTLSLDGTFTYVSPNCVSMLGYAPSELENHPFQEFVHIADIPVCLELIDRIIKTGNKGANIEYRILHKDGTWRWHTSNGSPIRDSREKVVSLIGISRDITQQKEIQERYNQIAEQSQTFHWEVNMQGLYTYVSPVIEKVLGYSPEELVNKKYFYDLVADEDREEIKRIGLEAIQNKEIINNLENKLLTKDGQSVWVLTNGMPMIIDNGEILGHSGLDINITDRKKTEYSILKEQRFANILVQASAAFYVAMDSNGDVMLMNESMLKALGYELNEVIGANYLSKFVPEEERESLSQTFDKIIKSKKSTINENLILAKDGKKMLVEWHGRPIFNEMGNFDFFFGIGIDITEHRRSEDNLKHRLAVEETIAQISKRFANFEDLDDAINLSLKDLGEVTNTDRVYVFLLNKDKSNMDNTHEWCKEGVSSEINNYKGIPIDLFPLSTYNLLEKEGILIIEDVSKLPTEMSNERELFEISGTKSALLVSLFSKDDLIGFIGYDKVIETGPWDHDDINILKIFSEILSTAYERHFYLKKLRKSEEKYRELVENANSIIAKFDRDGTILSMNEFGLKLFGYEEEELIGKKWQEVGIPQIDSNGKILDNLIADIYEDIEKYSNNINENVKKNGQTVWIHWTNKPIYDDKGNLVSLLCIGTDITERKRMEEELEKRERTLQNILSDAPIGINLVKERVIIWCNNTMSEITGYTDKELVGMKTKFLYPTEEEYKKIGELFEQKSDNPLGIESQWITKDGKLIDVSIIASPLNPLDYSKGYITIVSDITKSKIAQRQLDTNLEYFAHLVDQIRNPLAIMGGFIQVEIQNEKMQDRLLRQIDRIEELIKQLDQGWMDTEHTRRFLKKYT
ncbi:MAG: PAS domain S-box protein [Candidatus Methanofastidiosum sp.]|nr:PAS domain S-box protein [Methanofastidiosum sp.]